MVQNAKSTASSTAATIAATSADPDQNATKSSADQHDSIITMSDN